LAEGGRAGFVMSSQASSAGHGEKEVRRKIVETGDVDVMISIRSGFFYTRSVPCELWFFDRGKPKARRDKVLMIDARNVFRKVTRKINDFSPEQLANLSAIVWLYRGHRDRFLALVKQYFGRVSEEIAAIPAELDAFETTLVSLRERIDAAAKAVVAANGENTETTKALTDAAAELKDAVKPYEADRARLLKDLDTYRKSTCKTLPGTNDKQHAARKAFDSIAERIKGLIKQVDLIYTLAARAADAASELAGNEAAAEVYDRRAAGRLVKQFDEERKASVEQLKHAVYFHRQVVWLQDRLRPGRTPSRAGAC